MNIISELSSICESVFTGKNLISEKKDDENPFGANTKDENKDDDTGSNDSQDTKDTDDTSDDQTDDAGSDDSSDNSSDDSSDDSSDTDDTADNQPFGGFGQTDDTDSDENGGEEDTQDDGMGAVTTEEYGDVSDFGITLLMLATQIHFWHINCRSSADHNCLGNLYNDLIDQGDKLLENIVSVTKNSIIAGDNLSFDFGDLDFNKDESIGILEDTRKEADDLVARYTDNQGLCNIIGDISETLGTAIYMLSRFEA